MPSLIPNEPGIETLRQNLFALSSPIMLAPPDYDRYFDLMSNVWGRPNQKRRVFQDTLKEVRYYRCQMWNALPPTPRGKGIRDKAPRTRNPCGMRMKETIYYTPNGRPVQYVFERTGDCVEHTHTLDHMDARKRPAGVLRIAREQVESGYKVLEVVNNLKANNRPDARAALEAAGGKYLTRQDVANAAAAYIRAHPEPPRKLSNSPSAVKQRNRKRDRRVRRKVNGESVAQAALAESERSEGDAVEAS